MTARSASVLGPDVYRASHDRWLFYGLVALLVWAPWPLGSNRPLALALFEAWVFLLAALWTFQAARGWLGLTAALVKARWCVFALTLWLVYGVIQVLPLPLSIIERLSPVAAGQWSATWDLLGSQVMGPGTATLSLDPESTLAAWRLGLALLLVFVLVLLLVRSRRRLRTLAWALLMGAVLQAMLASVLALSAEGFWFIQPLDRAHGTYANQNHLAGFLEMTIALGVGLLISDLDNAGPTRTWRQWLRGWTQTLLGPKARVRIFLAILVITLVLTGSRMGNTAFFLSLSIVGAIGVWAYSRSPRRVMILLISLILVDLLILGSWFGLDRVKERLEKTVLVEEMRYHVDLRASGYLEDYLWFGSGGGSFYAVFPAYRDQNLIPKHVAHADNDLLEFQLEYGLLGMIPLVLVVALCLGAALRVLWRREDPLLRGMAFAALMGVTAILIHSSADANLHIPANAALFMVLLALPWLGLSLSAEHPP